MMGDEPQSDRTAERWREYNLAGMEKCNLVLVMAGTFSIALCTVCGEILIRHSNEAEAETFALTRHTYAGLARLLLPRIFAYHMAVLLAGRRCAKGNRAAKEVPPVGSTPKLAEAYHKLVAATCEFEERYRSYLKPKTGMPLIAQRQADNPEPSN